MKTLLLTGGLGYIGSHAVVAFEEAGYTTVIIDNLCNSSEEVLDGLEKILGKRPLFLEGDLCDIGFLRSVFLQYHFDGVIHFAGLKAVGESTHQIAQYHHNNITGSIHLFDVMQEFGVKKIVFSSSATVYDNHYAPEYKEEHPLSPTSPYGTTKLVIEKLLEDYARHADWEVISLRYFNPIGAHPSGYIGENPQGIPNNLLPYIFDVATGKREYVGIFGNDYETPDGTGVRDYIDVIDLGEAHKAAYTKLLPGYAAINIGTGKGKSVLEVIHCVEEVTEKKIPYKILPRREGDIALFYANTQKANEVLGWNAHTNLKKSIENTWKYRKNREK